MAKTATLAATGVSSSNDGGHQRWIDLVFLGRQTLGNKNLEVEILKLFKSQLELHLGQLAHIENDSQLRVRLHTIKGAAFGVGANEVAQLASKAEKELLNNGHVQPGGVDRLRQAVQQTCEYITSLLETK